MSEWSIGAVFDAVAAAVPDRTMTVCGDRRRNFGEVAQRTRRFANFLAGNGFGAHTARADLARWECGQDRVALLMHNDQYLDVMIGCLKARAVPVNVNPHYTAREIRDLLAYIGPRAVVYHRSFGPIVAEAAPEGVELLISVEDDSDVPELPGSITLEQAISRGAPDPLIATSPDDLVMLCTGGTTGRPKGVLWRQGDVYVSSMNGADHESSTPLGELARMTGHVWFAVSPLSHAAGIWTAFAGLLAGQSIVLYDDRRSFDPHLALRIAERERAALLTIVGDAYAGPLVRALREHPYELSALLAIGTGGAATNPMHRHALLELIPHVSVVEGYGSSETGGMGFGRSTRGAEVDGFAPMPGGVVLSHDRTRVLRPGDTEVGWAARTGRVPLGYLHDRVATERTFPVIDGVRMAVPGDRATVDADGNLRLLGRDALVVNTGGEKVFVEEVEEVLRAHPGISDALVVGRPSPVWGQEVVALVCTDSADPPTAAVLRQSCRTRLAGFKVPKAIIPVPEIRRLGNGKPDYRWAVRQVTHDVAEERS
ncbi:AMP-binding protein [Nocardia macrotermitis]|uniref:3-oxocholest-4-en-26-oate--CoA ligase n=1 Tax=Nocardia macrotermitis TaxID=2585198 RepID=A0A7K0DH45_9NOCA|nr:AMP-binding protein [Nocardia macrotermitis]MQY24114.1 3-oxocholest-4-en-26-oate--CoA ligase [Nocardia macrotermitis]